MKKIFIGVVIFIVAIAVGFFFLNRFIYEEKQVVAVVDYKDGEYLIEGQRIQLTDGLAETETVPSSGTKIVTRYFGNELKYDLNDDGREDVVFLLTQETGGSGVFYYAVAALNTERGYVGSDGFLLGDRIAPQTTNVSQNPNHRSVIVVNYADRASGEPMTASPSQGKSAFLKLDPISMQWGIVEANFEGEADVSRMYLTMKKWTWVRADYNDGTTLIPKNTDRFTIQFNSDGTFSATTDCNGVGGSYQASEDGAIGLSEMMQTLMYCEGSEEAIFIKLLGDSSGYHFTSRGELVLNLKFDSGSVIFR